jgi:hypothetical protein
LKTKPLKKIRGKPEMIQACRNGSVILAQILLMLPEKALVKRYNSKRQLVTPAIRAKDELV